MSAPTEQGPVSRQAPAPGALNRNGSVGEFLSGWLDGLLGLPAEVRLAHELAVRRYLKPRLGQIRFTELSSADIEAFYDRLAQEAARGAVELDRVHATLAAALDSVVAQGLMPESRAARVRPSAAGRGVRLRVWEAGQVQQFLDLSSDDRLGPLFELLVLTGLRHTEALGVPWSDVDLDAKRLRVAGVAARHRCRTLALSERLADTLGWHQLCQEQERSEAGAWWTETGRVFTGQLGEPVDLAAAAQAFDRLVAGIGVPQIRLADLRHTSAVLGLTGGESVSELSVRLGHRSVAVTARRYQDVVPAAARAATDRLAALIC